MVEQQNGGAALRRGLRVLLVVVVLSMAGSFVTRAVNAAEATLGGFGPEGSRMREQLWLVPSDAPGIAMPLPGLGGESIRSTRP